METPSKKFASAGTPQVVKEYRAELASALKKRGVSLDVFLAANNETRFSVSRSTLFNHVAAIDRGEAPLSSEKKSGRPGALTGEQWDIVCGAILASEEKCDLAWVKDFIESAFGEEVSDSTITRHLAENRLTLQMVGLRPIPKGMTREKYLSIYYEFLLMLHNNGFFKGDARNTVCLDGTTNSTRTERTRTYNIRGGKQKKFAAAKPVYTNFYLAAFCLEEEGRYPAFMFTHDPTFDPAGRRWKEVLEWCKAWNIDSTRIVFQQSAKQYCAEASWQVSHFLNVYRRLLKDSRVLHDAGNSFKIDGEYILADGAQMHYVFPPAPHGEMSVLDNNLFAIAKRWWRTEREKYCGPDFSKQALYLLYCIDFIKPEQVKAAWTKNFLLDLEKPTLQALDDRLRESNRLTFPNQQRQQEYLEAYDSWMVEQGEEHVFEALESTLDGSYWK